MSGDVFDLDQIKSTTFSFIGGSVTGDSTASGTSTTTSAMTVSVNSSFDDGTINAADGSTQFDTVYCDRTHLDVFHAGANALAHFNAVGWKEGRDPDAFFSTRFYLAANPDVKASGINPLTQYDQTGYSAQLIRALPLEL
jgi:serralysin